MEISLHGQIGDQALMLIKKNDSKADLQVKVGASLSSRYCPSSHVTALAAGEQDRCNAHRNKADMALVQ